MCQEESLPSLLCMRRVHFIARATPSSPSVGAHVASFQLRPSAPVVPCLCAAGDTGAVLDLAPVLVANCPAARAVSKIHRHPVKESAVLPSKRSSPFVTRRGVASAGPLGGVLESREMAEQPESHVRTTGLRQLASCKFRVRRNNPTATSPAARAAHK